MQHPPTLHNVKPLSAKMTVLLRECLEREINQQHPFSLYYTQSAKGLINRGLFCVKEYLGSHKPYVAFFLTDLGLDYLNYFASFSADTHELKMVITDLKQKRNMG